MVGPPTPPWLPQAGDGELDLNFRCRGCPSTRSCDGGEDGSANCVGNISATANGPSARTQARRTLPTVTTQNPYDIDWGKIAARARADLGDEPVARFSDRFRVIVMAAADALRPGDTESLEIQGADTERVTQSGCRELPERG